MRLDELTDIRLGDLIPSRHGSRSDQVGLPFLTRAHNEEEANEQALMTLRIGRNTMYRCNHSIWF